MGYVYILLLENNQYYIGSTEDVAKRYTYHCAGEGAITTKRIKPKQLLFSKEYMTIKQARSIETFLKKQKSHKIVEKFMSSERTDPSS